MGDSKTIYELSLKLFSDFAAEEMLHENNLKGLLNEDVSNSDLNKLRKSILDNQRLVKDNLDMSKQTGMKYFAEYNTKLLNALKEAGKIVSELDFEAEPAGMVDKIKAAFGKAAKVGDLLKTVTSLLNQANVVSVAMAEALDKITTNLEGKDIPEETLLKDLPEDKLGVAPAQLATAVRDLIKKAVDKPKGMMGKLKGFFKKQSTAMMEVLVGSDIEVDSNRLAKDIMGLTYGQLKGNSETATASAESASDAGLEGEALKSVATGDVEEPKQETESETSSEETSSEEPAPEKPEEESDPGSQIKAVAGEAGSTQMSPKDAVSKALDDWENSLAKSSRETLQRKKRNVALKDAVFSGIDKGKAAVQKAVAKAVKDWRSENEESLIKSKRFAKKNFDTLQQLIPQLAAEILAQTKESAQTKLTKGQVKRYVFKRLNKAVNQKIMYETWIKNASL